MDKQKKRTIAEKAIAAKQQRQFFDFRFLGLSDYFVKKINHFY